VKKGTRMRKIIKNRITWRFWVLNLENDSDNKYFDEMMESLMQWCF
jgi:hypothetical protein